MSEMDLRQPGFTYSACRPIIKKDDLANLKSEVDKLDIDKSSEFHADLLKPVPTDLSKLSDVVKNDVVKKKDYNAKIKNIEDKIPSITNLSTNVTLDAKINTWYY